MVRVKICGNTREGDVAAAVDAGADAVGYIVGFPSSPRNIPLVKAAALIRRVAPFVDSVLVTTIDVLKGNELTVKAIAPSAIQLYGAVRDVRALREDMNMSLIRPYVTSRPDPKEAMRESVGVEALLTVRHTPGLQGGTGVVSDWSFCWVVREAIAPLPLVLCGGLRLENVVGAISALRPYAVDVSSGVERAPGAKDHAKVREFVRLAREAS